MLIDVVVPSVGESISEVEIGQWRKAEGAAVARDDTLVFVETDKATLEISAPESGILTRILKQTGDSAGVGEVIARIEPGKVEQRAGDRKGSRPAESAAATPEGVSETLQDGNDASEAEKEAEQTSGTSAFNEGFGGDSVREAWDGGATAAAERKEPAQAAPLLNSDGGESADVASSVAQPSIPTHTEQQSVSPVQNERTRAVRKPLGPGEQVGRLEEVVPMSPLRRRIAQRLVQAQQTAALLTTFNEIDMTRVTELRQQYRQNFEEKHNVKLGMMSFFVKATVAALKVSPDINAEIRGEGVVYRRYYDIGIAVGGGKGLVVPVLRDADQKSFAEIETAIADFARRAREARLNPADLEGGTFTITNGGIYGSLLSTPIVNPPQTAILGMHAIQERPVARAGAVVVRPMMYVALTYDHRLVDGREAVSFLKHVKELVEEPTHLLFEI
jgi:2-oxoglutarate dehydrogenase E2 component (dihydrolipoamide succinyltransferase)